MMKTQLGNRKSEGHPETSKSDSNLSDGHYYSTQETPYITPISSQQTLREQENPNDLSTPSSERKRRSFRHDDILN